MGVTKHLKQSVHGSGVYSDFNTRCDDESYYIEGGDETLGWDCIDIVENEYGDLLIDFLVYTNMCMLNDRSLGINDFNWIKTTGKYVVDLL